MVGLLVCAVTLILGLALVLQLLIAKYFFPRKKLVKNIPNGNMGWLLVGETLAFLKPHKSNTMGIFLQKHCSRYGRVFKSHLFGCPAIVSCDLELNMFILKNEGKLFQASYPKQMHGILGDFSLLFVSGDHHKRLRRFVSAFVTTSKSSPNFLHSVEKLTISMMESWKELKQVSFCKDIKKFTLNLIVKNLLSIEPEEPLALNILQDFQTYMKGFLSLPLNIPGSHYAKAVKARARLSSYVKWIIKSREEKEFGSTKGDFLDEILSSKCKPSNEEIVSVVLDILLGGYETTSTLISLILYFLAHSPKHCKFFKEEHETIRKSKKEGEPLDLEDYQKMEFTQNVILEAMRCGNVVKFVHRKAIQDVRYKDYIIPSGWKVLPIFTGAHFDPSLHENPYEFNPWRWSFDQTRQKVTPFGGGPRLCPGAEVAKIETAFFLHHLVLNYRWRIKDDDDFPMAYPYVEFCKGLLLEIEPLVPSE